MPDLTLSNLLNLSALGLLGWVIQYVFRILIPLMLNNHRQDVADLAKTFKEEIEANRIHCDVAHGKPRRPPTFPRLAQEQPPEQVA